MNKNLLLPILFLFVIIRFNSNVLHGASIGDEYINASTLVVAGTLPPQTDTVVNYCMNASSVPLTATGTSLNWYIAETGGLPLSSAPVPNTSAVGTTMYYVSQTINGVESPRVAITVNVNQFPSAPVVTSPLIACQNSNYTITAEGVNLKWYTTSSGGVGDSSDAVTYYASSQETINYYVSQCTAGCGESPRSELTVIVLPLSLSPAITDTIILCSGAVASSLSANGSNLNWYISPTGGTASIISPIPQTSVSDTVNYYVSQNTNGCESMRDTITVIVNQSPLAPLVSTPVNYCLNAPATTLTAVGTNIKWYVSFSGNIPLVSEPVPLTNIADTVYYYSTQTVSGCESPRDSIEIIVHSVAAPVVNSPVVYCQNDTAVALNASGTSLLWYSSSAGGSGIASAPVPSLLIADSAYYYVSQTMYGCEGFRDSILVVVHAVPMAKITTVSSTTFCSGGSVILTSNSGSIYSWINGTTTVGTSQSFNATQSGDYTVTITDSLSCSNVSSPVIVTVTAPLTWYADEDDDGYGDPNLKLKRCTQPVGYVSNNLDLCPLDPNKIAPGFCGCGRTEQSCLDCAGVPNGTAYKDSCGNCVGGTTGIVACVTTGTIKSIASTNIIIYPQPFKQKTTIQLMNGGEIQTIFIYNVSGNLVCTYSTQNSDHVEIGDNLSAGLYTVVIYTEQAIYNSKIVKIE